MNKKLFDKLCREKQIDELKQYYLQKYDKDYIVNKLKVLNEFVKEVNKKIEQIWITFDHSNRDSICCEMLELIDEINFYKDLLRLKGD
jgi:hypothetical protein